MLHAGRSMETPSNRSDMVHTLIHTCTNTKAAVSAFSNALVRTATEYVVLEVVI